MKHISKRERKHPTKKTAHFVARTELLANGKIWVRMEHPRHQQVVDEQRPPGKGDDLKDEQ
jgi:hypothetical protein